MINKRFSQIKSARSDPLGNLNLNYRLSQLQQNQQQPIQNFYFDSDQQQSLYQPQSQKWKQMLLPQIDLKYQQIMRQREGISSKRIQIENQKSRVSVMSRNSKLDSKISNSRLLDVKTMQNVYEQKIESLEQQNQNLRQELFYLREALLINFQTKEKMKEKEQNSPVKNKS